MSSQGEYHKQLAFGNVELRLPVSVSGDLGSHLEMLDVVGGSQKVVEARVVEDGGDFKVEEEGEGEWGQG